MRRIEKLQKIEFGEGADKVKFHGEKRKFHIMWEQLNKELREKRVAGTLAESFKILEEPTAVLKLMDDYNAGEISKEDMKEEHGGIEAVQVWMSSIARYEKNKETAEENGEKAMDIIEKFIGPEVSQFTNEIRNDDSKGSLEKAREMLELLKFKYGLYDMTTSIFVNAEITNIGTCETHEDVEILIATLDAFQEEMGKINGMERMSDLVMIQHAVSRFPKQKEGEGRQSAVSYFYQQIVADLSQPRTDIIKWGEVVEMRRRKLEIEKLMNPQETKKNKEEEKKTVVKEVNMVQGRREEDEGRKERGNGSGGSGQQRWTTNPKVSNSKNRLCYNYENTGKCSYGDNCRFMHEENRSKGNNDEGKRKKEGRKEARWRKQMRPCSALDKDGYSVRSKSDIQKTPE